MTRATIVTALSSRFPRGTPRVKRTLSLNLFRLRSSICFKRSSSFIFSLFTSSITPWKLFPLYSVSRFLRVSFNLSATLPWHSNNNILALKPPAIVDDLGARLVFYLLTCGEVRFYIHYPETRIFAWTQVANIVTLRVERDIQLIRYVQVKANDRTNGEFTIIRNAYHYLGGLPAFYCELCGFDIKDSICHRDIGFTRQAAGKKHRRQEDQNDRCFRFHILFSDARSYLPLSSQASLHR